MHAPNSNTLSSLARGQRYRVNSFDLGFINIQPVDLMVEVKTACYETNELVLAPLPSSEGGMNETLVRLAKWFQEGYPTRTKDDCLLRNVQAFERLVSLGVVAAEKSLSMPLAPVSLIREVQQRNSRPYFRAIRLAGFLRGWRAQLSAPENRPL